MSFALTTEQIRNRTKTVTRRKGWLFLKPGDLVRAVVKSQGLKKGEKIEPLAVLRVVDVRREPLSRMAYNLDYGFQEAAREGFAWLGAQGFVTFFSEHNRVHFDAEVTRIEFEYPEGVAALDGEKGAILGA